jgi:hypothetical protein
MFMTMNLFYISGNARAGGESFLSRFFISTHSIPNNQAVLNRNGINKHKSAELAL